MVKIGTLILTNCFRVEIFKEARISIFLISILTIFRMNRKISKDEDIMISLNQFYYGKPQANIDDIEMN